jgi:hypothetical protein
MSPLLLRIRAVTIPLVNVNEFSFSLILTAAATVLDV